jgi:hypothetical protein
MMVQIGTTDYRKSRCWLDSRKAIAFVVKLMSYNWVRQTRQQCEAT